MLKLLISVKLITTFGQIRSNESLEILRNLLTTIANSAGLSIGLKGNAVKMKRKQTLGQAEAWRNNHHRASVATEGGSKK